jgi:hypothetical protein
MNKLPIITLRNLMISGSKCIGLQYYPTKVIDLLVSELYGVQYSNDYNMRFIQNTEANLQSIIDVFRGVAWINYKFFYKNKPIHTHGGDEDFSPLKEKCNLGGHIMRHCPLEYIQLLETRRYSVNTARSYCALFAEFAYHYRGRPPTTSMNKTLRRTSMVL